jgi:hypothetical protein
MGPLEKLLKERRQLAEGHLYDLLNTIEDL